MAAARLSMTVVLHRGDRQLDADARAVAQLVVDEIAHSVEPALRTVLISRSPPPSTFLRGRVTYASMVRSSGSARRPRVQS